MHKFHRILFWCLALTCNVVPAMFAAEVDFAVMISATAQTSPAQINLTWPAHASASEYRISRKFSADTAFTPLTTITTGAATLTSYLDTGVAVGTGYEYEVRRLNSGDTVYGYGYIASGINLPIVEDRGKLVLLVDETMATPLAAELTRLEADLRGDGWTILRHSVSRTASVPSVKALITTAYAADPTNVKAVFLFGRIPVPYSGDVVPDGHNPDHKGAWPADCYFGDMNGAWTDTSVNTTAASKYGTRNHNIPGDGKFDQSSMPGLGSSRIELMVGRVDLSSLPAYSALSETQLLKRYLDKDHAWRQGRLTVGRRGLIDENSNSTEKFAAGGYRLLGSLFGSPNTAALDYTTTLASNAYLASWGVGAGDTSSCAGVVSTSNFAGNDYRTVFTFLFGSYFGDWDSANNLLRAAIASPTYTLVSTWGSRPYPAYHTLGMGDPIGAGVRLTQNFSGNEIGDIYRPSHTSLFSFDDDPHISLMGDPTLRLHPVKPVTNLQQATSPSEVVLTWAASADSGIVGYHVYRASSPMGTPTRLTGTPASPANPAGDAITATSYTDITLASGPSYYMVRAVKLETSNTGSYFNLSQGTFIASTPTIPAAPTDLAAISASTSEINLTWSDNSLDETSFKLERSPDGVTGWTQIATVVADTITYSDSGLATGTVYYYRIRAANAGGNSEYSATLRATTLNGLQGFRAANGLPADGSQDLFTPADDGIENLLKYAFNMIGSDTGQKGALAIPNTSMLSPGGSAGMPLVEMGSGSNAGKLEITYIRRKAASMPGVTYAAEFSDTLASWAPNGSAVETVTSIDSQLERVTVTDSVAAGAKRFARVTVR